MRRCVPAGGYKVVGVLKCFTEAGGGTHLLHFSDAVLRAYSKKSKEPIKISPGHASACAHRMPHFQALRHVGVGESEAGQDLCYRRRPSEVTHIDKACHHERSQRLGGRADHETGVRRNRISCARPAHSKTLGIHGVAVLDDGNSNTRNADMPHGPVHESAHGLLFVFSKGFRGDTSKARFLQSGRLPGS